MKFIFDFDDVLFKTTPVFKEHMYSILEEKGVSKDLVKEYDAKERWNQFSLKKMLAHFAIHEHAYHPIMEISKHSVHDELIEIIKNIGKENCYIVSYGDEEFQKDKIKRSEIGDFFSEIIVVSGSKKEAIENICLKYKNEPIVFVDDKAKHFEDLDFDKCPNLKTILFDESGLEKLKREIDLVRN